MVRMNRNLSRWVQACTLCYVNLINYMDRYTVSGVLEDVKDEFDMEYEWMGGLIQTAFIVCYVIAAPIFGYLGDRYSRKWLIILGIFIWSSSIMASSFMPSYWPFLIVRATMGLGECGFTVLAPTLLGDLFHGKEITYVLALFDFSIPVGSVFFMFGLIMAVAGVLGLTLGSGLSYWLRPKYRGVDPIICGGGLVPSSILILISFFVAYESIWEAYILVFFGQIFLNMNWAVIVDMTLYVVEPTKRASAEAFRLMGSHAIGECLAPYIIGFITDGFKASYADDSGNCGHECDYKSWQKSFYIASSTEFLAAIFFLATAFFVVKDWDKAIEEEKEQSQK